MRRLTFTLIGMILLAGVSNGQIYVNEFAMGSQDGTSWLNAYNSLDDALASASEGAEIWVSLGEYKPAVKVYFDGEQMDTAAVFLIDQNVKLYGGFTGTETNLNQRNPSFNPTVLDGDILANDVIGNYDSLRSDNARHVLFCTEDITAATTIDGFVIIGGHAFDNNTTSLASPTNRGGGIYSLGAPSVVNCDFINNASRVGGALLFLNDGNDDLNISSCNFQSNFSTSSGAAIIAIGYQTVHITDSRIIRNESVTDATIFIDDADSVVIRGSEIRNNVARAAVALVATDVPYVTVSNTDILFNESNLAYSFYFDHELMSGASYTFEQCIIDGNMADSAGAVFAPLENSQLNILNSLITSNVVNGDLEATVYQGGGALNIAFTTFADMNGPILSLDGSADLSVANNIFTTNGSGDLFMSDGATTQSGGGNICADGSMATVLDQASDLSNTDPEFVDPMNGDYRPDDDSPCLNSAVMPFIVDKDVFGYDRDANPDRGAVENLWVSTDNLDRKASLYRVFPTIFSKSLNIVNEVNDEVRIDIMNASGQVVMQHMLTRGQTTVPTAQWATGTYYLRFNAEDSSTEVIRVVKAE